MKPIKNIHKALVTALLVAGVLFVGAQAKPAGPSDEPARVSEGKVSDEVSKVILWEVEKERVDATLPQFKSEGPAHLVRKSPLKRHRGRSGWDFVSSSFKIDHYHPAIIRLPEVYRASIHPAILVASSLRGPPAV